MRRDVMRLMAMVLLAGGVTACGDDGNEGDGDGGGNETTTSEQSDPGGTEPEAGGNAAITEFCDGVQQYVDMASELQADPSNAELKSEVTELGMDVGTQGGDLSGQVPSFSAAENDEFQACETEFTIASAALLGGVTPRSTLGVAPTALPVHVAGVRRWVARWPGC